MRNQKVLLVLDNFRIGGIQRLALDQLFMFSDLGISVEAYFRQVRVTHQLPNFLTVEHKRIAEMEIEIHGLPESNVRQILFFWRNFRRNEIGIVICHSLGAAVILRIASILSRRQLVIKSFVHQLPHLSAPKQRAKRFLYSLASHELFGYSESVVKDWNSRVGKAVIPSFLKKKLQLKLHRNGVYLNRLPRLSHDRENRKGVRLVFIGRDVAWKNLGLLFELLRSRELQGFVALVVLPTIDLVARSSLEREFPNRVQFEIGKKLEDIEFRSSDINVYPVDYGHGARFIESVSLNCLEMACLGIPSLITSGGNETWPELRTLGLLREVSWENLQNVCSEVKLLQETDFDDGTVEHARQIIDIRNNVAGLI